VDPRRGRKTLPSSPPLLDENKDSESIPKAEIGPELGDFDRCLQLLGRPLEKQWAWTPPNLVVRLARENQGASGETALIACSGSPAGPLFLRAGGCRRR